MVTLQSLGFLLRGEDGVDFFVPKHVVVVIVSHFLQDSWFRGGLEFKEHRLCVSLNSRLESNKEEEEEDSI